MHTHATEAHDPNFLSLTHKYTGQVRAWGSRAGTLILPPSLNIYSGIPSLDPDLRSSLLPCINSAWHSAQKSACSALIWISMSTEPGAEERHLGSSATSWAEEERGRKSKERQRQREREGEGGGRWGCQARNGYLRIWLSFLKGTSSRNIFTLWNRR